MKQTGIEWRPLLWERNRPSAQAWWSHWGQPADWSSCSLGSVPEWQGHSRWWSCPQRCWPEWLHPRSDSCCCWKIERRRAGCKGRPLQWSVVGTLQAETWAHRTRGCGCWCHPECRSQGGPLGQVLALQRLQSHWKMKRSCFSRRLPQNGRNRSDFELLRTIQCCPVLWMPLCRRDQQLWHLCVREREERERVVNYKGERGKWLQPRRLR